MKYIYLNNKVYIYGTTPAERFLCRLLYRCYPDKFYRTRQGIVYEEQAGRNTVDDLQEYINFIQKLLELSNANKK